MKEHALHSMKEDVCAQSNWLGLSQKCSAFRHSFDLNKVTTAL